MLTFPVIHYKNVNSELIELVHRIKHNAGQTMVNQLECNSKTKTNFRVA